MVLMGQGELTNGLCVPETTVRQEEPVTKCAEQTTQNPDMVHKVFGTFEAKNGTETDELLQAGAVGHQSVCQNVETNSDFSKTAGFMLKRQKIGKIEGKKRRITRKEYQRLLNKF